MRDIAQEQATEVSIHAAVCPDCKALLYPVPLVCRCGHVLDRDDAARDQREIAGPCTLLGWTRLKAVPDGFDGGELLLGMVEFPGGVRAVGMLDVYAPRTGMVLEAHAEPCDAGAFRRGPRYVMKERLWTR